MQVLAAPAASAADGVAWLAAQANADGSYALATDLATATQSTSEVLRTFHALGETTQPGLPAAEQFLASEPYRGSEYLARKIIAWVSSGQAPAAFVDELRALQNPDGGFGELPGFDSTPLDAAFALEAFAIAGVTDARVVGSAVAFLIDRQGADGGFALDLPNDGSIAVTALASIALQPYLFTFQVASTIDAASTFLLQSQVPGGGWGSAWETALALLALAPVTTDAGLYADAVTALRNGQLPDGSWGGDVFMTALAVRALHRVENVQFPVDPTQGTFTGRIVNDATGLPLPAVAVSLDQLAALGAVTGPDGTFVLAGVPPATYTVRYQAAGYTGATQMASTLAGQRTDLGTIHLAPLPDVGLVAGTITDVGTGLPIAGALIQLAGAASATADSGGLFAIVAPPGAVAVSAQAAGYDSVNGSGNVVAGATLTFSPALHPAGTTPSGTTVTVTGTVVEAASGQPITGAAVDIVGVDPLTTSDTAGVFAIAEVDAGDLVIEVTATGYQTVRYTALAPAGTTVDLGTIRLSPLVTATSTTVIGTVTDAQTGEPVMGADVTVVDLDAGAVTGADGGYRIEGVGSTGFSVTTRAVGYLTATANVSLAQHGTVTVDIPLQRGAAGNFDITDVTAPQTSYSALTEVELDVVLSNAGTTTQSTRLYLKAVNGAGEIVDQYPAVSVPLGGDPAAAMVAVEPGIPLTIDVEWHTARHPAGTYQVVVQAFDGTTGQLLAERGIPIAVLATNRIGGHAAFDPPIAQLAAQKPVQISATLANRGNEPIAASTVTARVSLKNEGYAPRTDLVEVENFAVGQGLDSPRGIDVDADGNVYVANQQANSVSRISPDGTVAELASGFNSPVDVDVDGQGNVYVLNWVSSFVRLAPDGTRTQVPTGLSFGQQGIEALADGRVLIAYKNALYEVTPSGAVNQILSGGLSRPQGMIVDSQGAIFIADRGGNRIARYADGVLSTFVVGINQPYGITIDAADVLYVTSYGDNALVKVTPDGTVTTVATGLAGPYDVKIAPDGHFVVSNVASNEIVTVTPTGTVSVLVGPTIYQPTAAAYDAAGDLYVGSSGWGNLVRLAADGSRAVVASGLNNPRAILFANDGGVDVLEGGVRLSHVALDGSKTTLSSSLSGAYSMAHAPDGNGFLVSETSRNRISHVDALGDITPHVEPRLEDPRAMRSTAAGDLVILSGRGYVTRIDAAGVVTRAASGLSNPYGLAVASDGSLYVSNYGQRQVVHIDTTGTSTVVATTDFTPGAVAITRQGQLLVAQWGGTTIYSVDASGAIAEYAHLTVPVYYDMVVDGAGNLWATSQLTGRIVRLAPDGTETAFASFNSPRGLALDDQGGVYVTTYGVLKHIDSAGNVSAAITGEPLTNQYLDGVDIDTVGRFWIVTRQGVLARYHEDRTLDTRFANLASPKGMIVADDGALVVANGNGTIVRLTDPAHLPVILATGSYEHLVKEAGQSALLTNPGSVKRLDLSTGVIMDLAAGFANVEALAVAPDGGWVVGDQSRNELAYYDAGDAETDRRRGIVQPKGLLFDGSGRLIVANSYPNSLCRLTEDGRLEPFADVSSVRYMWLEADGGVTAANGTQVVEMSAGGSIIRSYNAPDASGLGRNAQGELFSVSTNQGALVRFSPDGSYEKIASGLVSPTDVEVDASGLVHIADSAAGVVNTLGDDGSLSLIAADVAGAKSLAFAPDGTLFVNYSNAHLASFDAGTRTDFAPLEVVTGGISNLAFGDDGTLFASTPDADSVLKLNTIFSAPAIQPGDLVFTATATLPALGLDGGGVAVDFSAWTPTTSGDYLVEVGVDNGQTAGTLSNTLHVGPQAEGTIDLAQPRVFPGDRAVGGALRVLGADSTAITRIDAAGTTLAAISGAQGRAIGADSRGNIYAADTTRIVQITPDGMVSDFVTGLSIGNGLAVDSHDNIYAVGRSSTANARDVLKISPMGEVTTLATLEGTATAVAIDYSDRLYAVDSSNTLSRIHADGSVDVVSTSGLSSPQGLTIDAFGNFYILNHNSDVVRVTPAGQVSNYFDQAIFEFEGIDVTADCANNLLFAPTRLLPFKTGGEEDVVVQIIGDTGEVQQVLYGPDVDPALSDMDVLFYDRLANRLLIWTDKNNGKIFSFPVVCGGIDVEAHLVTRGDVDLSSADPPPTTVIDRGDGTVEYVWSLAEVDIQGESIGLDLLFHGLTEGELRPAFQDAFLSFSNSFDLGQPVQVPIRIPDLLASSAMAVTLALDAPEYGPDAPVAITATVTNASDAPFDGTLALSIIDAAGAVVADLPSIPVTALPGLAAAPFTAEWHTAATYAGDHTLLAHLLNGVGGLVADGEAIFRIRSGDATDPTVTTSLFTDRPVYAAWDTLEIGGRVRNVTTNVIQGPSVAEVTVTDPIGTVVLTAATPITNLQPGGHRDLAQLLVLVDAPAGLYTVELVGRDATTGVELSTSQAVFEVARSNAQGLAGDVSVTLAELIVGETNLCTESATNLSTAEATGLTLRHLVGDMDSGAVVGEALQTVDLAGGETLTDVRGVATAGLQTGAYACVLQVAGDRGWKRLGSDVFTVLPVPTRPPLADAGPDQTTAVGATVTLDGGASSDPDGDPLTYRWTLLSVPSGSRALLSDPLAVAPTLQIDKKGAYLAELIVNDGTVDSTPDTVTVTAINTPPVAHAGPDQPVFIDDLVTLDGSGSTDVDGDGLTYRWSVVSAPADSTSTLSDPSAVMPALMVDAHGRYEIQLIVHDGTVDSAPDTVVLTVGNVAPVADAGPDQAVHLGDTVTLDGSASHDADGDVLTYRWSLVDHPVDSGTTLSDPSAATPTLVIDRHGTFVAELVVNDGIEDSAPNAVSLTVLNVEPMANAGPDQSVSVGDLVTLDGSRSSDADGDPLTYLWSILSRPDGSTSELSDSTDVTPMLEIDAHGMFVVQIIVHDGLTSSDPDTAVLDVLNVRPVADAGPDQAVIVGKVVTLDGSASHDADGDALSYQWSFTSRPAGSTATFTNAGDVTPTFVPDQAGFYIAQVIVDDGILASDPATVTIHAQIPNEPPDCGSPGSELDMVLWPPNHTFVVVANAGITDPDGDPLTVTITGVTQDEPVNDTGDGATSPDAIIDGDHVQLRKERSSGGNGRVYQIQFTADDAQGGSCTGAVRVGVPLSQGANQTIVDDGQDYDATLP
jgi:sugar lactone lactonase YvrE